MYTEICAIVVHNVACFAHRTDLHAGESPECSHSGGAIVAGVCSPAARVLLSRERPCRRPRRALSLRVDRAGTGHRSRQRLAQPPRQ